MPAPKQRRKPAWGKIAVAALVCVALAAAWKFTPLADYLTRDEIQAWSRFARSTWWAPLAIVLAYTPAAVVMFPRPALTLLCVVSFGTWLGFALSALGVLVAALAMYAAGRFMRYETIKRIAGDAMDDVRKVLKRHGILSIFALNMSPTPPFSVQGVIAGAAHMRLWEYALGTLLSLLPSVVAWTVFGSQINAAISDTSKISIPMITVGAVVLIGFAVGTRFWFSRQAAHAS